MEGDHMLYAIIIGAIAGFLAGKIMKGEGFGIIGNIIIGIIGGFVGRFLLGLIGFASTGLIGDLIAGILGAVVLVFVVNKIKDGKSG